MDITIKFQGLPPGVTKPADITLTVSEAPRIGEKLRLETTQVPSTSEVPADWNIPSLDSKGEAWQHVQVVFVNRDYTSTTGERADVMVYWPVDVAEYAG